MRGFKLGNRASTGRNLGFDNAWWALIVVGLIILSGLTNFMRNDVIPNHCVSIPAGQERVQYDSVLFVDVQGLELGYCALRTPHLS